MPSTSARVCGGPSCYSIQHGWGHPPLPAGQSLCNHGTLPSSEPLWCKWIVVMHVHMQTYIYPHAYIPMYIDVLYIYASFFILYNCYVNTKNYIYTHNTLSVQSYWVSHALAIRHSVHAQICRLSSLHISMLYKNQWGQYLSLLWKIIRCDIFLLCRRPNWFTVHHNRLIHRSILPFSQCVCILLQARPDRLKSG